MLEIVINQFLNSRDVFMEKHWKSVISRSICDYFFDAQNKATSPSEVSKTNIAFEPLPSANISIILAPSSSSFNALFFWFQVPPVISTPHHFLISIYRCNVYFVAVIMSEVPPLFVVEFLHRVVDTFEDYFGECSEAVIKVRRQFMARLRLYLV